MPKTKRHASGRPTRYPRKLKTPRSIALTTAAKAALEAAAARFEASESDIVCHLLLEYARRIDRLPALKPATPPRVARHRVRGERQRICTLEGCGRAFRPGREWQRFCSTTCRYRAWDLDHPRVRAKRA
jgi:hypothetical protein